VGDGGETRGVLKRPGYRQNVREAIGASLNGSLTKKFLSRHAKGETCAEQWGVESDLGSAALPQLGGGLGMTCGEKADNK